jgi:cation transport regulator ChaC
MSRSNFIFGYGSLVHTEKLAQYLKRKSVNSLKHTFCTLRNYRRCWNVAMNNQIDLPGYKYYLDRETGKRPKGFVVSLNIYFSENAEITGILFGVNDEELQILDKRERNYRRIEVTNHINISTSGKVWTYLGLEEAKKRYQEGLKQENAMISRSYFDLVRHSYLSLGKQELFNYMATTDEPQVPILNLEMCRIIKCDRIARRLG